jgi:hypothetical protein
VIGGTGAGATENSVGLLSIKANSPVGLFASTSDGSGSLYNLAPLTGSNIVVATVGRVFYSFGKLERRAAQMTCTAADLACASIGTNCGITMAPTHTTGVNNFVLTARLDGIETDIRGSIFVPVDVEARLDASTIGVLHVSDIPLMSGTSPTRCSPGSVPGSSRSFPTQTQQQHPLTSPMLYATG